MTPEEQAAAVERVVRARMLQQDTGTFGLILRDDEAAAHIAAALRAARKAGLEEAATIVTTECERVLATQQPAEPGSFGDSVNTRMLTVLLPEIAAAIRALAERGPT